jgi:hypothetical protein
MRRVVTDVAAHIHVGLSRRFSELAVFDARLYILEYAASMSLQRRTYRSQGPRGTVRRGELEAKK